MKKILFFAVFFTLAISSFAVDGILNRQIYIEGTAFRPDFLAFFMDNFRMEAIGAGYTTTAIRREAGFIFRFDVTQNLPAANQSYTLNVALIRRADNFTMLSFNLYFNRLEETFAYNREMFLRAVSLIPPVTEEEIQLLAGRAFVDDRWQNKWIYFRTSLDFPISFYQLRPNGLIGGSGVYQGTFDNPLRVAPIDNTIIALPGATLGLELQFLYFMSMEVNFQFFMGEPNNNNFLNVASGLELKIPIKTERFFIQPYLTISYPLIVSPQFTQYPLYFTGMGIQIGVRSGRRGVLFIDIRYLDSYENAFLRNPFGDLFPNPAEIQYRRTMLNFAVGYKFGIINRRSRPQRTPPEPNNRRSPRGAIEEVIEHNAGENLEDDV